MLQLTTKTPHARGNLSSNFHVLASFVIPNILRGFSVLERTSGREDKPLASIRKL
jgi:hypothetical protein